MQVYAEPDIQANTIDLTCHRLDREVRFHSTTNKY